MYNYFIRYTFAWSRKGITTITMASDAYTIISLENNDDICDLETVKKLLFTKAELRKNDVQVILYIKDIITINKL